MVYLNTARNKLKKFFSLSFRERLSILKYSVFFHFFLFTFRFIGYRRLRIFIDRLIISENKPINYSMKFIKYESRILNYSAANTFFKATCLEKSLFSYFILGLYGISCDLKIGINNFTEEFSAHAWIEHKGNILNDTPDVISRMSPF